MVQKLHGEKLAVCSRCEKQTHLNVLKLRPSLRGNSHLFEVEKSTFTGKPLNGSMIMGGRSESTSESKSVTTSGRNSLSQDDKRSDLKGRKQAGKLASGDKKNEASDPSKLTYTSEEGVCYEPGGKNKRDI